ncbi:hypothetical protein GINT2_000893 [Glugoides intestinalis]
MEFRVKKRKRTVLTTKQHKILMQSFEDCAFPDAEKRHELGKLLNMSARTVQIWFQNQRQKIKNQPYDSKSNLNSDESTDSIEQVRIQSSSKSLSMLAHLACIEYDRKFNKRDKNIE